MLRACIAIGLFPQHATWSVSIMAVSACCSGLGPRPRRPPRSFTAEPRETKGDLVEWNVLCG